MSHYGLCEACAAAGATGLRCVEPNRRERLWITHDYRRLCDYHYERYIENIIPPRIINRAAQNIYPDDCCTIEELENKLDADD